MSIIPKLSKRESYKVLRNSFTTAAVAVLVLLVLFVDFVLAEALQYIMETEHENSNMGNLFQNLTRSGKFLYLMYVGKRKLRANVKLSLWRKWVLVLRGLSLF